MTGLVILVAIVFLCLVGPELLPYGATDVNYAIKNQAPTKEHIFGTDDLGRDMLARTLYGGKISLYVGILSALLSAFIGVPLGILSGYYEKSIGRPIMRIADVFMSFPHMVLMLVVVAMFRASTMVLIIVIGVINWPSYTRLVYSNTLSVRKKDYVESARAIGTKNRKIIWGEIFPNVISPIWVNLTFGVAKAILNEATMSFLGVGVQPPLPSWGNLVREALSLTVMALRPWIWIPSGIMLIITVVCVNFVGDGIRDALDPHTKL
ncbi:MAG: ABC transporter permease [Spirochaetales bacterium]|nr:ABC transporter permease [Spirochaetales bacterium]